jgi:hypothetical protein
MAAFAKRFACVGLRPEVHRPGYVLTEAVHEVDPRVPMAELPTVAAGTLRQLAGVDVR